MTDDIIAEVWRNRDLLTAKYHHNLDELVAAIRERERHPLTPIVRKGNRSRRRLAGRVAPAEGKK